MATKSHQRPQEDDWAGLAQNLFGINLDKDGADDDLLNEDLFQVEIPKPPEPPPVEVPPPVVQAPAPAATTAAPAKPKPRKKVVKPARVSDDPFGAGILDDNSDAEDLVEEPYVEELGAISLAEQAPATIAEAETDADDGLTLAPDFDSEGLTLPMDYDDGLTLAPESLAEEATEAEAGEVTSGESSRRSRERPRKRFRKREDAYWDLLENFEWEEIGDSHEPRSGERSGGRGDRGSRRGGRDRDRGDDRGRRDRPRRGDRSRSEGEGSAERRPMADAPVRESSEPRRRESERAERPRDRDRSSDRDRRRERPDREREPAQRPAEGRAESGRSRRTANRRTDDAVTRADELMDDFAFGIFDDEPRRFASPPDATVDASPLAGEVAPSGETEDQLVEATEFETSAESDDLVWGEDDSDVRLTPANREMERLPADEELSESSDEQAAMPAAERWDESEGESDVRPIRGEDDEPRRRRRRRRRRRGEAVNEEGTVFDLNGVLADSSESPDQVPDAVADAPAEQVADENEDRGERRGRRRRRRRAFSEERPASNGFGEGIDAEAEGGESADQTPPVREREPEEIVLPKISYGNVPSWEEAIRYLLNPHLVGRNLGPDDEFESLEGDPRGSGGSEPVAHPPARRFRRGGGRGRRPPPQS